MKLKTLNFKGSETGSVEISDKILKLKMNHKLVKNVVDWQLNHLKARTAKTKQRNEIKGSTRKIVPQKGSGGARHASRKAPIFVGGGIAHGPKGDNYKVKKINKKMRKLAIAQTISKKNNQKSLHILDDIKSEIKKTKDFNKFLKSNKIENVVIISDENSYKNIYKSARNIKNLKILLEAGTNVYDLLKYKNVIFTSSSISKLQKRILNEN
tara:strand:- start:452 stop:1084 length:633 start_codon:yes stop_codon:yes gene_type:complete